MLLSLGNSWHLTEMADAEQIEDSFSTLSFHTLIVLPHSNSHHVMAQKCKANTKAWYLAVSLLSPLRMSFRCLPLSFWTGLFPIWLLPASSSNASQKVFLQWSQAEVAKHLPIFISLLEGEREMDSWDRSLELIRSRRQVCKIDDYNTPKIE